MGNPDAVRAQCGIPLVRPCVINNPAVAVRQSMMLLAEFGRIASGGSALAPDPKDRRFADPVWKDNAAYRALAQSYLAWGNALYRFLDEANIDSRDAERARFLVSLLVDALSPTNSLAGNPAALKKVVETGGASLLHGFENFVRDVVGNGGLPAQVDTRTFGVGKNLATTPGAVVLRTEVMELIQYRPPTDEVHQRPLLIAPPLIALLIRRLPGSDELPSASTAGPSATSTPRRRGRTSRARRAATPSRAGRASLPPAGRQ